MSILRVNKIHNPSGTEAISIDENTAEVTFPNGFPGIGVGQTWQNVTSSRSSGTVYTNNTGKPIMVCVTTAMGTNQRIEAEVGGVKIMDHGGSTIYGAMGINPFIVPDNTTYEVTTTQGTIAIWAELR